MAESVSPQGPGQPGPAPRGGARELGAARRSLAIRTVFVGVPSYNRPEGLARTLACLRAQTHADLRILVSDNASPDPRVAEVAQQAARQDPRVRYLRQPRSLGAAGNFRFLLAQADSDYFMWAADDDEWQPGFVEACLRALHAHPRAVSAMTGIETLYRASGRRVPVEMPAITVGADIAHNWRAFLQRLTPGLIYGLHRRDAISFFLEDEMFDYYDCYFALRLLAQGEGIALVPERLHTAGVDGAAYVVKPSGQGRGSGLRYRPFHRATRRLLATAALDPGRRLRLECRLAALVARLALVQETRAAWHHLRGRA